MEGGLIDFQMSITFRRFFVHLSSQWFDKHSGLSRLTIGSMRELLFTRMFFLGRGFFRLLGLFGINFWEVFFVDFLYFIGTFL